MGKKRRIDAVDLDAERTLYSSFVSAANSMSQLYSQAVQQQRKSSAAASRQTLERMLAFLLKEYGSSDVIPKAAMLHFLQQEYENVEGSEHLPHSFPVQFLPTVTQGHIPADDHHVHDPLAGKPIPRAGISGHGLLSPSAKRANSSTGPHSSTFAAMDTAEHDRHMGMEAQPCLPDAQSSKPLYGGGFGAC